MKNLQVELSIESRQDASTPFELRFTMTNVGENVLYVSRRNTPLEGLHSDCLVVKRDNKRLFYDGPLVKRAPPNIDDYVELKSGETISRVVDISSCYQVSQPGKYTVGFVGQLNDAKTNSDFREATKNVTMLTEKRVAVKSNTINFRVGAARELGRATLGEVARRMDEETDEESSGQVSTRSSVKPPKLVGGTSAQKTQTTKAHTDLSLIHI